MEWRLFFSTFALIFLAELGDKTQLASMAASAGTKSPWSVFAGAASALVLSALAAVLVGSFLQRTVPKHLIQGVAAVLFLIFGVVLLLSAFEAYRSEKAESVSATSEGILAKVAFRAAEVFERESAQNYFDLAEKAHSPQLRELLLHLACEEQQHLSRIHAIGNHEQEPCKVVNPVCCEDIPPLFLDEVNDVANEAIIEQAIKHELATAQFYRALAQSALIPEVRSAFVSLASEEESHVRHLEEFRDTGKSDVSVGHEVV